MDVKIRIAAALLLLVFVSGCAGSKRISNIASDSGATTSEYLIGPGDTLQVFVWRNPEFSVTVPVRPDGKFSTPLVEDIDAVSKTPSQLAREIEGRLARYIKKPVVTVIVTSFVGPASQQIRVIGEVAQPQALPYRQGMTLLDVMIAVNGLTDFAAGNKAKVIRVEGQKRREIPVKLQDLLRRGNIKADMAMRPGDILIIPQSIF